MPQGNVAPRVHRRRIRQCDGALTGFALRNISHFKEKLREALPLSLKLGLKRVAVGLVRLPLRIATQAVNAGRRVQLNATTYGLNIHQELDVLATPRAPYQQQFGSRDFLFLVDVVRGREDRKPDPDREVVTSIILLCYNKADLTFQCLRSLLREVSLNDTEIIVVNNASVDETKEILSYFDGYIRVLNNDENLGFVHGNNEGAKLAKGKYLIFLNNDTVVLPGWLEHMVETAERDSQVGAVGPMFIYPDWTLQEAGSIVWSSGKAFHYGWGRSPEDRRFNFAREVDFVTGASLLIRRSLFEQLGGFDRIYAPIYYEDVDLCFGVRALGFKVIYQPLSRILHFEGATSGTETGTGLKRFQVINQQKFVEKWQDVLDREHLDQDLKRLEEASNRNRDRPRVVVFDERIPTPDRDAGSLRMFIILKTLARWCHVIFVPFNSKPNSDYERALWKEGIETADAVDYRRIIKHPQLKAAIVSRASMGSVFVHRLRYANPAIGIIFDTVDVHFHRLRREYAVSGDEAVQREAERYRKLEGKLARTSDLVWCASAEDKEVITREVPEATVEVVPTIHELRDPGPRFADRRDLLFIGNLAHRPNEDAVLFFAREVFPLLHQKLPEIQLDIIGDPTSSEIAALNSENVRIRGYVADVEPFLRSRRVFVAPLRFGAGIKGKVGEALAYGIPVVTTTVGAEGFGATHGHDIMIADDPVSFAEAIAQLYADEELWQRVATKGRLLIEKHFTPVVIAETIKNSIKQVSGAGARP